MITINEKDLIEARQDPRVKAFLTEADAYLLKMERAGRSL